MSLWLHELGAEVHGLSLLPDQEPALFTEAGVDEVSATTFADIRSLDAVVEAFEKAKPDIVFHLAAQSLVRRGYSNPVDTYATNVMGTVNVLEAVRHHQGVRAVVIVTSDKCYEDRHTLWSYRETDPLGGRDPYSSSKGCAELVTFAYQSSFFGTGSETLVASARAGNVIGGGDWADDRIVPDIVRALSRREPVVLRNPNSVRPWQHVLEPLRGYLLLGAHLLGGRSDLAQPWNFGPPEEAAVSVRALTEAVIEVWGEGSLVVTPDSTSEPHEASFLSLDATKARRLLGFKGLVDLELAIKMTVDWYRAYQSAPGDAGRLTTAQIIEYLALMDDLT
jgi:CDP-glucose 4,6-dehydratase